MHSIIPHCTPESKPSSYRNVRKEHSPCSHVNIPEFKLCRTPNLTSQRHKIISDLITKHRYKGVGRILLHEIVKRSGKIDCISWASQTTLAKAVGSTARTVGTWIKRYVLDGLIRYEEMPVWGPGITNRLTVLCIQHLSPFISEKSSYDINNLTPKENLNLQDRSSNITYCDVCISDNLEKNVNLASSKAPATLSKRPSKHIDAQKLSGPDMDEEINRVGEAWKLDPDLIAYAKREMKRNLKIKNPVSFLASMLKGLAKGTWSTGSLLKKVDDQKKGNYNSSVNTSGDTDMRSTTEAIMHHQEIYKEAEEMAARALKARGVYDPMLMREGQIPCYEQIEKYRNMIADERIKFVSILSAHASNASRITKPIDPGVNFYE